MTINSAKMIKDWKAYREQALKLAEKGIIIILGDFCAEMEEIVFDAIDTAKTKGNKTCNILINSFGGRSLAYTQIKGAMALSGMKFTGIVLGAASSAGFMLLQSCHLRYAIPGSYLMFHWGQMELSNAELAALDEDDLYPLESLKRRLGEMVIFVSKRTGISVRKLRKFALYERKFLAQDALQMRFLDGVLSELPFEFKIPEID